MNEMIFFYNLYRKFIFPIDTRGRILIANMGAEKMPFQLKSIFLAEKYTFSASILSFRNWPQERHFAKKGLRKSLTFFQKSLS